MNHIDEDFYIEESNPKKVFFSCLAILFVLGAIFGAYYYFWQENTTRILDVTIELGDPVPTDITVFMRGPELELYTLDTTSVRVDEEGNTDSVGEYSFRVSRNGRSQRGRIFVVDTTPPTAETQDLIVGLNERFEAEDFLTTCFDLSGPCYARFARESDEELSEREGTHTLSIIISDRFDNEVTKTVTLIVDRDASLTNLRAADLEVSHLLPQDNNWDNTFTFKFDRAVFEDSTDLDDYFLAIANEDFASRFEGSISNVTTIAVYNQYNMVIGLVVRINFADGTTRFVDHINIEVSNEEE